mmetsp:Transcript_4641/g.8903  ORF Transcript_4641/g.8903 Transcript_4641/m.8903 type:complete len:304 (+) Transcript_4641:60-971(+)
MADFDNLLDDLEDVTQPSLSINDVASPTYDETHDLDDDDNADENEEGNIVPPALQAALLHQRKQDVIDEDIDEQSRLQLIGASLDLYGEPEREAHANEEYDALKKLWIQELNTTELCYYDENLIEYLIGLLNENENLPDNLREHGRADADPTLANIAASICNMDMERLRFILVDLFRIRLEKIEKYALHNRECTDRMCGREVEYLKSYGQLFQGHLERTVTDHFPKELWKRIDESDMIPRPDLDTFVFCKVIDEEGIVLNDYKGMDSLSQDENEQHKSAGDTLFVRFQTIRDFVEQGKVELLM